MALDPNIILQNQPTQSPVSFDKMLNTGNHLMQLQQQSQAMRSQNALRQILSQPGAMDQNGVPTPQAMQQVTAVDPEIGMKLRQNALTQQEHQLQMGVYKTKAFQEKLGLLNDSYAPVYQAYTDALKTNTPEQALAIAQKELASANQTLDSSGAFSDEEKRNHPTSFDPVQMKRFFLGSDQMLQRAKVEYTQAKDQRVESREEAAQRETARHNLAMETNDKTLEAGWTIETDPNRKDAAGNLVQYRYNPRTAEATTLDGKQPYTPSGAQKLGGPAAGAGSLTPEALDKAAQWYHSTHELPPGYGGMAIKTQVMDREAQLYPKDSFSVSQMAALKADRTSLVNLTKVKDSATSYEKAATAEFDQAVKAIPKTAEPLNSQLLTRWARTGATQFGDTKVPVYTTYLISGLEEYAKILSGATGSAGSTDAARKLALELVPAGASSAQIPKIIEALKQGMRNRTGGYDSQIADIQKRLDSNTASDVAATDSKGGDSKSQPAAKADQPAAKTDQDDNFYRGDTPPADHPNAKRAKDGRWVFQQNGEWFAATKASATEQPAKTATSAGQGDAAKLKAPDAQLLAKAKAAIAKGAPRDAVIKKLADNGYNASGL